MTVMVDMCVGGHADFVPLCACGVMQIEEFHPSVNGDVIGDESNAMVTAGCNSDAILWTL